MQRVPLFFLPGRAGNLSKVLFTFIELPWFNMMIKNLLLIFGEILEGQLDMTIYGSRSLIWAESPRLNCLTRFLRAGGGGYCIPVTVSLSDNH